MMPTAGPEFDTTSRRVFTTEPLPAERQRATAHLQALHDNENHAPCCWSSAGRLG